MSDDDDDDLNPFGDSSDEDDDFFHSYKTSTHFHKRETCHENWSDDESPPKRARKQVLSATDTALDKLQRRRERNKHLKPFKMTNEDDDDSDVEIVAETTTTTHAAAKKGEDPVELLDSSDDEQKPHSFFSHAQTPPVVVMQRSGVAKDTCDKIMQARNARFKLLQAQQYHAEDCYVPELPPPATTTIVETIEVDTRRILSKPTRQNLGPPLPLVLRTTQIINGKRSSAATTETINIREMEPIQHLMENYQSKHNIVPAESSVKFSFDGQRMDLLKTPKDYDLEANDIIEVLVTTLRTSGTSDGNTSSTVDYGPPLRFNMRTLDEHGKLSNEFLSIRMNEPLEHLLNKYTKKLNITERQVIFKFDGERMDMKRTPKSYDMEEEDIIDVVLK
eukprot:CAMPEP_0202493824 /NCGR_PEP_ID=MMETSP1361-20130828/10008_1 /ASSEMBLY_ACC=CAM_ASM_000849 /TAXON_ID=210615 /ORGANISM="Staurosira complex sp., Strain CCMP2646" /LENGTH=390 /DNA_ID=CAMNT_0049124177 /DNA_START=122 /DNA_END=1294 /DNA_ORIENTATION=-